MHELFQLGNEHERDFFSLKSPSTSGFPFPLWKSVSTFVSRCNKTDFVTLPNVMLSIRDKADIWGYLPCVPLLQDNATSYDSDEQVSAMGIGALASTNSI